MELFSANMRLMQNTNTASGHECILDCVIFMKLHPQELLLIMHVQRELKLTTLSLHVMRQHDSYWVCLASQPSSHPNSCFTLCSSSCILNVFDSHQSNRCGPSWYFQCGSHSITVTPSIIGYRPTVPMKIVRTTSYFSSTSMSTTDYA